MRLLSIAYRKSSLQKKEKVSFINSKFINFILIKKSMDDNIAFTLCTKNPLENKQLWSTKEFTDLNLLNNEGSWEKNKKLKQVSSRPHYKNYEKENVFLAIVSNKSKRDLETSLEQMKELSKSLGKQIVGWKSQLRKNFDTRTLMGKGVLDEILLESKYYDATSIIFNQELSPIQSKEISKLTNIKITDRTELILQIFEKNAKSKEAHNQIELARLRYELPRLTGFGKSFSQIAGGIRSKGPGEKKSEQRKRYIRRRINMLEKQIDELSRRRFQTRSNREKNELFSATLIGYTCAGKSTLFNRLTKSQVTESTKPFSTLNPTTRKAYLSNDLEILLTDTVGFISDLPNDLISSFRATLEEITESNILVHIVDASDPDLEGKVHSVEETLLKTHLIDHPRIIVFNKIDLITSQEKGALEIKYGQPMVSSLKSDGILELRKFMENFINSTSMNKKVVNI